MHATLLGAVLGFFLPTLDEPRPPERPRHREPRGTWGGGVFLYPERSPGRPRYLKAPRHKDSEAEIQRSYGAPSRPRRRGSRLHGLSPAKRIYEPRIFEGRVMVPEEQEQIYEEIIQFE